MPLRDFNPKLSDETREAISAAFDAIAECHNEVAASSEKVVTKIAQAARVLGWPDQVVSGMINQMESITKMQIQTMDCIMDAWEQQIKAPNFPSAMLSKLRSLPSVSPAGSRPEAAAAMNPHDHAREPLHIGRKPRFTIV